MTLLGNTITSERMQSDKEKVSDLLCTLKIDEIPKQIQRSVGFFQNIRSFIAKSGGKLLAFHHLLRKEKDLFLTEKHDKLIDEL